MDLGEALLLVLHHCTAKRGLAPLWIRHKRPDPPLAEVQVAEEERFFFGFNLYVTVTLLRSINGIPGKSGNARLDALNCR